MYNLDKMTDSGRATLKEILDAHYRRLDGAAERFFTALGAAGIVPDPSATSGVAEDLAKFFAGNRCNSDIILAMRNDVDVAIAKGKART